MCHGSASNVDVAFNSFAQVQKKTIRKPKHNSMQSLSISRAKTRGFTAQGSVNKRLNQIELQKMKGKHEWGNEGADVVSDQITISTGYWRGKRLIELFYHTESLRLSLSLPAPKTNTITSSAGKQGSHICGKKISVMVQGHGAQIRTNGNSLCVCSISDSFQITFCSLFLLLFFMGCAGAILTFGNLSGSPGCLGMTFCSLWNP